MDYKICLKKVETNEKFEKNQDNIMSLTLQGEDELPVNLRCTVELCLSKEAMLGLGKGLIREAHKAESIGSMTHFYPARPGEGLVVTFGMIVHPESIEPIIGHVDLGTIESHINKENKEH